MYTNSSHNLTLKKTDLKIGRRTEEMFFQRGNADGQQACEKMPNISSHQRNVDPNLEELSPHTYRKMAIIKK